MNRPAFREHPVSDMHNLESPGLEHLLSRLFHVLGHAVLVVSELIMKPQRGNAPLVFHYWIQINEVLVARQNLTEGTHANVRGLVLANFFLEGRAEAVSVGTTRKHAAPAATFKAIAADELGLFFCKVAKSGQVESTGAPIVES